MATVVLLRHGRSTANTSGILAGRSADVHLDEHGRDQVARAARRLADVPLAAVVSSPLDRCRETADALLDGRTGAPAVEVEEHLVECDYGEWQGGVMSELMQHDLWPTIQERPSQVTFPGGESMTAMQERAVAAIRHHDRVVEARHGAEAVWVAVSHGDLIKSILADALGMDLDRFQRLHVDPASISIVHYSAARPDVVAVNTSDGDLSWLRRDDRSATVGGGAGPA